MFFMTSYGPGGDTPGKGNQQQGNQQNTQQQNTQQQNTQQQNTQQRNTPAPAASAENKKWKESVGEAQKKVLEDVKKEYEAIFVALDSKLRERFTAFIQAVYEQLKALFYSAKQSLVSNPEKKQEAELSKIVSNVKAGAVLVGFDKDQKAKITKIVAEIVKTFAVTQKAETSKTASPGEASATLNGVLQMKFAELLGVAKDAKGRKKMANLLQVVLKVLPNVKYKTVENAKWKVEVDIGNNQTAAIGSGEVKATSPVFVTKVFKELPKKICDAVKLADEKGDDSPEGQKFTESLKVITAPAVKAVKDTVDRVKTGRKTSTKQKDTVPGTSSKAGETPAPEDPSIKAQDRLQKVKDLRAKMEAIKGNINNATAVVKANKFPDISIVQTEIDKRKNDLKKHATTLNDIQTTLGNVDLTKGGDFTFKTLGDVVKKELDEVVKDYPKFGGALGVILSPVLGTAKDVDVDLKDSTVAVQCYTDMFDALDKVRGEVPDIDALCTKLKDIENKLSTASMKDALAKNGKIYDACSADAQAALDSCGADATKQAKVVMALEIMGKGIGADIPKLINPAMQQVKDAKDKIKSLSVTLGDKDPITLDQLHGILGEVLEKHAQGGVVFKGATGVDAKSKTFDAEHQAILVTMAEDKMKDLAGAMFKNSFNTAFQVECLKHKHKAIDDAAFVTALTELVDKPAKLGVGDCVVSLAELYLPTSGKLEAKTACVNKAWIDRNCVSITDNPANFIKALQSCLAKDNVDLLNSTDPRGDVMTALSRYAFLNKSANVADAINAGLNDEGAKENYFDEDGKEVVSRPRPEGVTVTVDNGKGVVTLAVAKKDGLDDVHAVHVASIMNARNVVGGKEPLLHRNNLLDDEIKTLTLDTMVSSDYTATTDDERKVKTLRVSGAGKTGILNDAERLVALRGMIDADVKMKATAVTAGNPTDKEKSVFLRELADTSSLPILDELGVDVASLKSAIQLEWLAEKGKKNELLEDVALVLSEASKMVKEPSLFAVDQNMTDLSKVPEEISEGLAQVVLVDMGERVKTAPAEDKVAHETLQKLFSALKGNPEICKNMPLAVCTAANGARSEVKHSMAITMLGMSKQDVAAMLQGAEVVVTDASTGVSTVVKYEECPDAAKHVANCMVGLTYDENNKVFVDNLMNLGTPTSIAGAGGFLEDAKFNVLCNDCLSAMAAPSFTPPQEKSAGPQANVVGLWDTEVKPLLAELGLNEKDVMKKADGIPGLYASGAPDDQVKTNALALADAAIKELDTVHLPEAQNAVQEAAKPPTGKLEDSQQQPTGPQQPQQGSQR